jgi:putative FmdB family regulatory protein
MPTYEYLCRACGHEFELFQSMTDPVKRKCPKCGKPRLERLIGTGAGVIFKGGGFYETDYRSDSYKKAAEAETKAKTDGASKKDDGAASSAAAEKETRESKSPSKTPANEVAKPPAKSVARKSRRKPEAD